LVEHTGTSIYPKSVLKVWLSHAGVRRPIADCIYVRYYGHSTNMLKAGSSRLLWAAEGYSFFEKS